MVKVELSDESQLDELLSAEQYSEMIGEYFLKLLDIKSRSFYIIILIICKLCLYSSITKK